MNVYFFDPSHINPDYFPIIYGALHVKGVYIVTRKLNKSIRDFCQNDLLFVVRCDSHIHEDETKYYGNSSIYYFVDSLLNSSDLNNLYKTSSNDPLENLTNRNLDDPNLMVLIPPMPYEDNEYFNYVPCDVFPHHFAQFSLNILRKKIDDRFSERIAFFLIDSYLGRARYYIRKNVINSKGMPKTLVVRTSYKDSNIFSTFLIDYITKNHPGLIEGHIDNIAYCAEKMIKAEDYAALQEHLADLKKLYDEEEELKRQDAQDWADAASRKQELEDMYRDAFDNNPEYVWNID